MKKTLALVLAAVMLLSLLSACKSSADETPTVDPAETEQTTTPEETTPAEEQTPEEPQPSQEELDQAAADNVAALIDAIYVQSRTDETDAQCEAAKAAWDALTDADLAALAACGYRQASCEKLHFDEHEAFSSLCFLEQHLTLQQLQAAADHLFAEAACGHVLRVKGFAPDPQGTTGWLELNATAAGRTLEPIPQGQDVLIVIGEGLDKAAIEARLKA